MGKSKREKSINKEHIIKEYIKDKHETSLRFLLLGLFLFVLTILFTFAYLGALYSFPQINEQDGGLPIVTFFFVIYGFSFWAITYSLVEHKKEKI